MGSLLSTSIKKIEEKIKKEAEEGLAQVGIIRKIPVVGPMWNWMSPLKPADPSGTSFNLLTTQEAKGKSS